MILILIVDKQDSCFFRIHNTHTFIQYAMQKRGHYHPTITQINSQSARCDSATQMNFGFNLFIQIHIKYIHKDMIILQWIKVSINIMDIVQWIINIQMICVYDEDVKE